MMNTKDQIAKKVSSTMERQIQDAIDQSRSDKASEDGDSVDESEESDDEDGVLNEAWQVTAMKQGYRGNPSDIDDLTVNNSGELNKLARSGKYEFITVVKPNGSEVEYSVNNGKLVEM